jgi:DNA ligase-1
MRAFDNYIEQGYEGIIVRHYMGAYERKRSTMVMKFKPKKVDDYVITGTVEEMNKEGMEKGSLGAITCLSGDGNLFNVGTGFTAEQRQLLWEVRDTLPGRKVRIKYQHLTTGKQVPRFPVFVEVD